MSLSKPSRRIFLASTLALASCGFEPTASGQNFQSLRGKVQLPEAKDKTTYWMRRELTTHFGAPQNPIYALEIEYSESTATLAVTEKNVITRRRLTAKGRFIAKDLRTGKTILDQPFERIASYSSNADLYASDQAKAATEENLVVTIAQEFATRFYNAVATK